MVRKILFQGFFRLSKVQIAEFLRGKTTYSLWTIRGPVGGQVQSVFVVSSSWQCGYWFNYLKVMPVFIRQCGSLQAKKGKETQFPLCALTRTYHSTSTVVILFFFPSVHVSMHSDPCRTVSRWHLTFITPRPWLSLLSSLLWCSITLSSWGKHWCQATVMTFWLSVFMWWMRWKCTTAAKRELAPCQAATRRSG